MSAPLYQSRFCNFEVPPGWLAIPGLGAVEQRTKGVRQSAIVSENWLEERQTAAAYAAGQRDFISAERPGTTLLEEKPASTAAFSDAHWMAFRAPGPDGAPLRQELLVAVEGPLAACLTLTGPEDPDRWRRSFDPVRRSFDVTAREWLRRIARAPLLTPATDGPRASPTGVPHLQIALPVPQGWTLDAPAATLRAPGGAEIGVRRAGLPGSSPEELFAEALARANRDAGLRPRVWDHSRTSQGWDCYSLECQLVGGGGTWTRLEPRIVREAFVRDESAIAFRLEAAESNEEAKAALSEVVSGYALLPLEERRLRLPYPWFSLELAGPWQEAGPGTFVRLEKPALILSVQRIPAPQGFRKFAEGAAQSLRAGLGEGAEVLLEEGREERTERLPFARYALEYREPGGKRITIRGAWFDESGETVSLVVRGTEAKPETEDLFRRCLGGLRLGPSKGSV